MNSTRIIAFTLLILSLGIASCAAYFSISGLAELFSAAMVPVIIMTGTLEAAKLGATFYVHRWWDVLPAWKWLIALMIAILMAITSMGIFGFLSKGHLDQEAPLANNNLQIERIEERSLIVQGQIDRQVAKIKQSTENINKLDGIVNKLIEFDRIRGVDGANAVLKSQESQRDDLEKEITIANNKIDEFRKVLDSINQEKIEIRLASSNIEAKLGPIIYVAQLFGFDLEHGDGKGKAVRLLIVMLMIAFDPLAIVLIMAFSWTLLHAQAEEDAIKLLEKEEEQQQFEKDLALLEATKGQNNEMVTETLSTKQGGVLTPGRQKLHLTTNEEGEQIPGRTDTNDNEKEKIKNLSEPSTIEVNTQINSILLPETTPKENTEGIQIEESVSDSLPELLIQHLSDENMTDDQLVREIRSNREIFEQLIYIRDMSKSVTPEDRSIAKDLLNKVEQIALAELKELDKPQSPKTKPNTNEWLTGLSGKKN